MWLDRGARYALAWLFFIISGCVASSPVGPKQFNTEQGSSVSDETSIGEMPAEPIPKIPEGETIFSPEPRKFDGLEELHRGPIAVQVRMAQPADLQDFGRLSMAEGMTIAFGSIILVGAAFGAAALPLLGAYAAWGAIFFGGVAPGMSAFEQHRQSSIAEAIGKVDFPQIAQTALQRRLGETISEAEAETATIPGVGRQVEVVVLSYGFAWGPVDNTACSFLQAEIRLTIPNHEPQNDWVYIEPSRRSNDAPPAYCSYAKKLFADDSALACQTLSESAEILAAIVANRLEDSR
ncbi:MAG TPA: hypothetical protein VMO00_20340 [Methylomirabilota bacterium]|nr:hypothetical protein [Methylomirabilota bacterium]